MAVRVTCPNCDQSLKLADESRLGKKIKCPGCGEPFTAESDAPAPAAKARAGRAPAKPAKGAGGSLPLILGIGGAVLAVALVAGFLLMRGGGGGGAATPAESSPGGSLLADSFNAPVALPTLPTATTEVPLEWLPPDTEVVVHLQPAKLWQSPLLKAWAGGSPAGDLNALAEQKLGVPLEAIESLTFGYPQAAEAFAGAGGGATPPDPSKLADPLVLVVRTTKPLDGEKLLKDELTPSQTVTHAGKALRVWEASAEKKSPALALYAHTPQVAVIGSPATVKAAIDRGEAGPTRPEWAALKKDFPITVAVAPLDTPAPPGETSTGETPAATNFLRSQRERGLTFASLSLDVAAGIDLRAVVVGKDAETTGKLNKEFAEQLEGIKGMFGFVRSEVPPGMAALADQLLGSAKLERSDRHLTLTAAIPASSTDRLQKLPVEIMGLAMSRMAPADPVASSPTKAVGERLPGPTPEYEVPLAWLPFETETVVHVEVAELLKSPLLKAWLGAVPGEGYEKELAKFTSIAPGDVESVTVGMTGLDSVNTSMTGLGMAAIGPDGLKALLGNPRMMAQSVSGISQLVVVRTTKPIDPATAVRVADPPATATFRGRTLYTWAAPEAGGPTTGACEVAPQTYLVGAEADVRMALEHWEAGPNRPEWARIHKKDHVTVAVLMKPPAPPSGAAAGDAASPGGPDGSGSNNAGSSPAPDQGIRFLSVAMRMAAGLDLDVTSVTTDAAKAETLKKEIEGYVGFGRLILEGAQKDVPPVVRTILKATAETAQVRQKETEVTFSVGIPPKVQKQARGLPLALAAWAAKQKISLSGTPQPPRDDSLFPAAPAKPKKLYVYERTEGMLDGGSFDGIVGPLFGMKIEEGHFKGRTLAVRFRHEQGQRDGKPHPSLFITMGLLSPSGEPPPTIWGHSWIKRDELTMDKGAPYEPMPSPWDPRPGQILLRKPGIYAFERYGWKGEADGDFPTPLWAAIGGFIEGYPVGTKGIERLKGSIDVYFADRSEEIVIDGVDLVNGTFVETPRTKELGLVVGKKDAPSADSKGSHGFRLLTSPKFGVSYLKVTNLDTPDGKMETGGLRAFKADEGNTIEMTRFAEPFPDKVKLELTVCHNPRVETVRFVFENMPLYVAPEGQ